MRGLETGKLNPSSQTGSRVRYFLPVDSLALPSTISTRGLGSAADRDAICWRKTECRVRNSAAGENNYVGDGSATESRTDLQHACTLGNEVIER